MEVRHRRFFVTFAFLSTLMVCFWAVEGDCGSLLLMMLRVELNCLWSTFEGRSDVCTVRAAPSFAFEFYCLDCGSRVAAGLGI